MRPQPARSSMFGSAFAGRRVLVTGDTGFKGAWLCRWLHRLDAEVIGLALPPEGPINLYDIADVARHVEHHDVDVRDGASVLRVIATTAPDIVIHMAAQPLVRRSYVEPVETFAVNALGTAQVLEAIRLGSSVRVTLVVTTDKVYENHGDARRYREGDALGGHDPYSASKAACEHVVSSYRRSFFQPTGRALLVARAGNVIGGGDFAQDRLVPDIVRSITAGQPIYLRHPHAVRPWQHVLDALSGYLHLTATALMAPDTFSEDVFNFGPAEQAATEVTTLAQRFCDAMGRGTVVHQPDPHAPHEAHTLQLDITRAQNILGWRPVWSTEEAIAETATFYRAHLEQGATAASAMVEHQLETFEAAAVKQGLVWTKGSL